MPRIFGSHITGPRILVAVLVLFYGAFWIWYGGAGRPLSPQEIRPTPGRRRPIMR